MLNMCAPNVWPNVWSNARAHQIPRFDWLSSVWSNRLGKRLAIHERLTRETICKWATYVWAAHSISVLDLGHMTCQKNLAAITFWIVLLPSKSCLIQVLFPNYETMQPKKPPGQWLYKAYDRLEEVFCQLLPKVVHRNSTLRCDTGASLGIIGPNAMYFVGEMG